MVRRRDQLTKEIFLAITDIVSSSVADVQVGVWDKRDRRDLSNVANRMAASLTCIRSALACQQLESGSASRPVGPSQLQQAETKTERSSP
jgi:hypothetical protein